ncbi:MAG: hypothetical protein EOP42_19865, partial [Sphingobacteriaceae bacterium]
MKKKGKSKVKNKELESSITNTFMQAVYGLGHDAEKLKKEIAKAGKSVSQKISSALKNAQKNITEPTIKKDKPVKKEGKKKNEVKAVKAEAKAEKVVTAASKAAAVKTSAVSSRSVSKPASPKIDELPKNPVKIEEVKEVLTETVSPVKRKRAPRRTKEEVEAAKSEEKTPVN